MTISSINSLVSAYQAYSNSTARKAPSAADSPSATSLADKSYQVSVAVTLPDGTTQNQSMTETPMAVAWAPQMFVQGDTDGDDSLSKTEFESLLKRAGETVANADKLFASFDQSGDGSVSLTEFVDGVNSSVNSGSDVFNKLMNSYVTGADGQTDESAMDSFLSAGAAEANAYWRNSR
ncbi:EF-hand domain-containing protein [Paraburkholderia sp. BL25I1N1]|uniref:EF-hand domain-containing protein n=1 Tax=Paraburkholderia sp. BL25I1N1 TaxID=1938804 RepID=UPI000D45C457|nr:EF-hand domain-containing protein [Paraburkholderia sp. BL25I1N1]PRY04482.1 EF hand domain-containing protein [Paraburkholderia sp. BL25I1N1]